MRTSRFLSAVLALSLPLQGCFWVNKYEPILSDQRPFHKDITPTNSGAESHPPMVKAFNHGHMLDINVTSVCDTDEVQTYSVTSTTHRYLSDGAIYGHIAGWAAVGGATYLATSEEGDWVAPVSIGLGALGVSAVALYWVNKVASEKVTTKIEFVDEPEYAREKGSAPCKNEVFVEGVTVEGFREERGFVSRYEPLGTLDKDGFLQVDLAQTQLADVARSPNAEIKLRVNWKKPAEINVAVPQYREWRALDELALHTATCEKAETKDACKDLAAWVEHYPNHPKQAEAKDTLLAKADQIMTLKADYEFANLNMTACSSGTYEESFERLDACQPLEAFVSDYPDYAQVKQVASQLKLGLGKVRAQEKREEAKAAAERRREEAEMRREEAKAAAERRREDAYGSSRSRARYYSKQGLQCVGDGSLNVCCVPGGQQCLTRYIQHGINVYRAMRECNCALDN